ncbi:hypothetical protein GR239_37115, partial [Rhizobium leguminosarum]
GSVEVELMRRREREATIERIEVVRSRFVFDEYFAGDTAPRSESVLAVCNVGGPASAPPGGRARRIRKERS